MEFATLAWPYLTYKINEFIKKCINETVLIRTTSGPIKGLQQKTQFGYDYAEFRGVPYAKPPIGELRFKDPEPVEPWTEPLVTTTDTYACQRDWFFKHYLGNEDCLHINIYTKNLKSSQLYPVMIFIHGGALQFGSNTKDLQSPEFLLRENIVLFFINYRLGALGFLSIDDPALEIPGNAGLKDQVLAMKWIKENARTFGGDPNNITIFGNSAGASSVHFHMISEMSKGLFHKAICMSGTALNFGAVSTMKNAAEALAKKLGWNGEGGKHEMLNVLRAAKAKSIIDAQEKIMTKEERSLLRFPFMAVVEPYISRNCFIPKNPVYMAREAWSHQIPLMLGACSHEGLFVYRDIKKRKAFLEKLDKEFEKIIPIYLEPNRTSERCHDLAMAIKRKYFGYTNLCSSSIMTFIQLMGDMVCWHGVHRTILSRLSSSLPSVTYLYRFNFDSPSLNHARLLCAGKETAGTSHADDCSYIFKNAVTGKIQENSREFRTVERMVKFWTTFAKYGNPNNEMNPLTYWYPIYTPDEYSCMNISDDLTYIVPPELERMHFWDSLHADIDFY